MPARNFNIGVLTIGLIGLTGMLPLSAQLPSLGDGDNLGYFVVARSKSFSFGMTSDAKTTIKILDIKGTAVNKDLTIGIGFNVTETTPDGKKVTRKLDPESLQTKNAATDRPKNVVFTGKVTGDIEFEATVSEERGMILLGGRLLNAAALKNPTQFSIEVDIPSTVPKAKSDANKKETKEMEDKIKRDKVQITWTDGKKVKFPASTPVDGASKEVSGPGITAATLDFSEFRDREIQLTAAPNSSMVLSNKPNQRLSEGFSLIWTADTAKDPDGKARLAIAIR